MPTKKVMSFLVMAVLMGTSLLLTKGIKQVNTEEHFMAEEAWRSQQKFANTVKETSSLIIQLSKELSSEKLKAIAAQFQIPLTGPESFERPLSFLPFESESEIRFIAEFPKHFDPIKQKNFFALLEKAYPNGFLVAGSPHVNNLLNLYSEQIQQKLFPLMFVISFLCLIFLTRNPMHTLNIFLPSLCASGVSLLAIQTLYGSMDMITSIVPLLCFVLNLSLGLHLFFTQKETADVKETFHEKMTPIVLMVGTTCIGFGSLYFSPIEVISRFGILSFGLILLTSAIHLLFARFVWDEKGKKETEHPPSEKFVEKISGMKMSMPALSILSLILLLGALVATPRIRVLTEGARFFPPEEKVLSTMKTLAAGFIGTPTIEVLIHSDDTRDLELFKKVDRLQKEFMEKWDDAKILSPVTIAKEVNLHYTGSASLPAMGIALPPLLSQAPAKIMDRFLDDEWFRITVFDHFRSDEIFLQQKSLLEKGLKEAGLDHELGGLYYNLRISHQGLMKILAGSFLMSLGLILVLSFLYFRRLDYLCIFLMVNVLPVGGTLIIMSLLDLTFNIATIMTFSISLGMVVDGTFHMAHDHLHGRFGSECNRKTKIPILTGGIVLFLSFLMFSSNNFLPIRDFGICLASSILFGMIYDLYVLPTLLEKFAGRNIKAND